MDDNPGKRLSGLDRDPDRESSDHSARRSDKADEESSSDEEWKSRGSNRRRPRYWPEVTHGQVGVPAAEGGTVPKVKEIVLTPTFSRGFRGECLYGDMWGPESRSNAVVVGYVDSIPDYEDTKNTAVEGEEIRRPCPSAIMINYRPLLALLGRVMGMNTLPTPCLMVYPFKSLVNFHDAIEAEFRRMSINVKQGAQASSAPSDATETTTESQTTEKEIPKQVESAALLDSLKCLVRDFMHNYLHDSLEIRNKIASVSLDAIAFADLWQLFRPGTTIIQNGNPMSHHKQQAYRIFYVEAPSSEGPSRIPDHDITLYCYSLAYDGVTFRPGEKYFHVTPYHGLKEIRHLSVLPIKFVAELESKLLTRGRNFLAHRYGHKRYAGRTEAIYGMPEEYIDDDVFVDFEMGLQYCSPFRDQLKSVYPNDVFWFSCDYNTWRSVLDDACRRCQDRLFSDDVQDRLLSDKFCHGFRPPTWTKGQLPEESDEGQEILLPPWVIAMRLSSQQLYVLWTGLIDPIELGPSPSPLDNLALPFSRKAILTAIVNYCKAKNTNTLSEARIAQSTTDSGQGLVILLHGPPGSGKSDAVKVIAQSAHPPRPVYHLKGGVPPSEPEKFANCLKRDLQLASRWGCVVLFDDAEVFLSERADNINKNRLVCIFLSILDDFRGVIFLTTNRVGLIDEALKTRIHIALPFLRPSEEASEKVWRDQIKQGRQHYGPSMLTYDEKQIIKLVRLQKYRSASKESSPWNVRKIQNAFHASVMLAAEEHRKGISSADEQVAGDETYSGSIELKREHLTTVFKLNDDFESYLAECRGNDEERAFEFSMRADNFETDSSDYGTFRTSRAGGPKKARHARLKSPPPKSRYSKRRSDITSSSSEEEDEDSDVDVSQMKIKRGSMMRG